MLSQPPLSLDFIQNSSRTHQTSVSPATAPSEDGPPSRRQFVARTKRGHHLHKYRVLLLDSYDNADAMLVLPLPADAVDEHNRPIPEKLKQYRGGVAYLVVGSLAHELRDPQNRARLRAAVHPYRLTKRSPADSNASFPDSRDSG